MLGAHVCKSENVVLLLPANTREMLNFSHNPTIVIFLPTTYIIQGKVTFSHVSVFLGGGQVVHGPVRSGGSWSSEVWLFMV